jgi:uncharacterized protein YdcH (DUF465 family)
MIKLILEKSDIYNDEKGYKYIFRSPILLTTDESSDSWFEPFYDDYNEYKKEIDNAIGSEDLATYLKDDRLQKVSRIRMRTQKSKTSSELLDLITTVIVNEKLTDAEIKDLKRYLTGQFSDGWGEGFEQSPIYSYKYEYDEWYEDEETGEEEQGTSTDIAFVFCHVWYNKPSGIQSEPWSINYQENKL